MRVAHVADSEPFRQLAWFQPRLGFKGRHTECLSIEGTRLTDPQKPFVTIDDYVGDPSEYAHAVQADVGIKSGRLPRSSLPSGAACGRQTTFGNGYASSGKPIWHVMMTTRLDAWIERIRSTDPMTFEDAYFGDRPQGPEVLDRLIRELRAAADGYTRGKFCELLGEMGDTSTIAVLALELNHPDERVRQWAGLAIEQLKGGPATQESGAEYRARFASAPPKND